MEGMWTLEILDLTEGRTYLLAPEYFTKEEVESAAQARISDIQQGKSISHIEGEKVFRPPLRLYITNPDFNKQLFFSDP